MCKKNFCYLSIFFISVIFSFLYLDYKSFNFSDISWLKSRDNISDFLALKFFLNDKWRFPLGLNPNYGQGLDNTIIVSDGIPILAILLLLLITLIDEIPVLLTSISASGAVAVPTPILAGNPVT